MAKHSTRTDDGTDPGIPGGYDDEIEEISADDLAGGGGGVVLGDPAALAAGGAEKTRVASIDDLMEPGAEATVPGEVEADRTMITVAPSAPSARTSRGRLTIVAGKEEGKVIELTDGSRTLGRSREADVCLLDIQVSRKHCELVADSNGVLVRDLGSGNGTLVNGQPITESSLVHGDEIEIGDHVLRFEEEGPVSTALAPALSRSSRRGVAPMAAAGTAASRAPLPSVVSGRRARRRSEGGNKKKKVLLVAGIAAILLIGIGVKMKGSKSGGGARGGVSSAMMLQKEYRSGLALFKADKYEEALAVFESVLAADPRHPSAKKYIDATKREMAASAALAEGNRLMRAGDFVGARGAFSRIPAESLKHDVAERSLSQVKQSEADVYVQKGERALLDEALADARSAFERANSILPGYRAATAGLSKVMAREEQIRANDASTAAGRRAAAARAKQEQIRRDKAAVRAALAPGERAFDRREFNSALSKFEGLASSSANPKVRALARKKASALKAFKPAYDRGMAAVKSRKAEDAVTYLGKALSRAKVVSKDGKIQQAVQKQLSDMLYLKGRVAFNANHYDQAYKAWSTALRVNPGQNYAREGLRDLKKKAKDLYLEGYTRKALDRDQALRKFKLVTRMTPSDFEYHKKARAQLETMAN